MATFLFDEHVFGPIKSRRLGSSLGINLLSVHQKVCNFNCVYCECGLTKKVERGDELFVHKDELFKLLKSKLKDCIKNGVPIDAITFAGNGEPTMHPNFLSIVKGIIKLRNKYFPSAKIAVLTNGYMLNKTRVNQALKLVDKAIVKLDAGDNEYLKLIDQPKGQFTIEKLMSHLREFDGKLILQTMFLKGNIDGKKFDNSTGKNLEKWIERVSSLSPSEVMLYSLDRDTPISTLQPITKSELLRISKRLSELNIITQVV